ncbi:putative cytoplasm protein [Naematelia encephala]|uniref:Putative cytoplasm protein n=1 Tax=Naematelia encephala TaxID=71784 RepID=A0A1Y2B3M1_9TREE|nr:putative cytoplasm protein [Naematelia encephala]
MATEQTEVKACCVTGHLHEGTPLGSTQILHGLSTYVSDPKGTSKGTIIFINDIFGVYPNAKLLADEWAGQGYRALFPDVFDGDAVPVDMLNTIVPNPQVKAEATALSKVADGAKTGATLGPWLVKHREAVSKPKIEEFVQAVRQAEPSSKLAVIGFCWGGRYACLLARDDSPVKVDAVVANHPSFLVNADVEDITFTPVCIIKGTDDDMMSDSALDEVEGILKPKLGDKFEVYRFPDAVHGFTIRGDQNNEKEKKDKEDANEAAMKFVAKSFGL